MMVLGLETASPSGGAALFDGERLLGVQLINSSQAHSRLILPAVQKMLEENDLTIGDLGAVAVSAGPGSFTGVRVGLTLGKALCEPSDGPGLVLVPTLEALAARCWRGEAAEVVVPLLNAMRGEVYGAVFAPGDGGRMQRVEEDFVCAPEEIVKRVEGRVLFAGEGALAYRDLFEADFEDRAVWARADGFHPGPEQVALLGRERALRGEFADPATAGPIYLREAKTSQPKRKPRRLEG